MCSNEYSIKNLQGNLTMLRKLYGWTMEQMGEKLGVTKQTISNLEHGSPTMTKIQYIAIRAILEAEANERTEEERNNLLRILKLVCDESPEVSKEQRKKALEIAEIAAASTAGGVAATSILSSSLTSLGLVSAIPVFAAISAGTWISALLKIKKK